jgi:hypothetical protein
MAAPSGVENRAAPRVPASELPSITGVRVLPGMPDATLVNLSATGVLVDCGGRMPVGATISVEFEGTFVPSSVRGRVVRCAVSAIARSGQVRFHVGIAFKSPIVAATIGEKPSTAVNAAASSRPLVRNRW